MAKVKKLDIKKELARLPKDCLIELICATAMMQYQSEYQRASVIHRALYDYAFAQTQKFVGQPVSILKLKAEVSSTQEMMRIDDLNTDEIKLQLLSFYSEGESKRESERTETIRRLRIQRGLE